MGVWHWIATLLSFESASEHRYDQHLPKRWPQKPSQAPFPAAWTGIDSPCHLLRRNITHRSKLTSHLTQDLIALASEDRSYAYLCNVPKTGCTQWNELAAFMQSGEVHIKGDAHAFRLQRPFQQWRDDTIKVFIARNPFTRFLSGYLQRPVHNQFSETKLLRLLIKHEFKEDIHHFRPQTEICGDLNQFDYVLKLEHMSLWWKCLVKDLKLEPFLDKWSKHRDIVQPLPCSPQNCSESMLGMKAWPISKASVGHERHTNDKTSSINPEMAKLVTIYYKKDFLLLGYPLWDGIGAFYST